MNAVSYSHINTYQRCPKKYEYTVVQDLQPKAKSVNLFNGINAHEFLKIFFLGLQRGLSKEAAVSEIRDYAEQIIAEAAWTEFEDALTDAEKETEFILMLIERYIDRYVEEWEILHVEEQFIFMLEGGTVVSFTPDLVVRDRNGDVWIVDHKTTSRVPDGGLPFGDTQAFLYYAGVKALYPECRGFIFNRIRKKMPAHPRLTSTGQKRVSDLNRIDTTYEILRDFMIENELMDDLRHRARLAELKDQGDRFFWTEAVHVTDEAILQIIDEVDHVAGQIQNSVYTGLFPRSLREDNGYMSCSRCPFQRLCHAELVGWDSDLIRAEDYEPRDPKNEYESAAIEWLSTS